MKRYAWTVVLACLGACSRSPQPTTATYHAPDGSFSVQAPLEWKVDDHRAETPGATFFGPPDGDKPYSQRMSVYFYVAADSAQAARAYLAAHGETAEQDLSDAHGASIKLTVRTDVVPAAGGFYALVRAWPEDSQPSPALEAFVGSFRAGKPTARANLIR